MPNSCLLIVDDEPDNLDAMRQILGKEYRLLFARNGVDALRLARQYMPDLALLDIGMPQMDGYELCRALKTDPATEEIQVIFVTALTEVDDEEMGFEAGAVDYIIKPVSPRLLRARVRTHLSLVRAERLEHSYRDAMRMLGEASHFRDTDTGMHTSRMAAYATALASSTGWSKADCALLELAAPMHDLGKLGIPDCILLKPGKLDTAEWDIMKTHARIGHDILSTSKAPVFRMAALIALHHHERWDGKGYPDGLAGEAIPEVARVVAVADVFDALTMKRPYKEPWPVKKALEFLHAEAGRHFDPRLVMLFESILPRIMEIKDHWDKHEFRQARHGSYSIRSSAVVES